MVRICQNLQPLQGCHTGFPWQATERRSGSQGRPAKIGRVKAAYQVPIILLVKYHEKYRLIIIDPYHTSLQYRLIKASQTPEMGRPAFHPNPVTASQMYHCLCSDSRARRLGIESYINGLLEKNNN